MTDIFFKPYSTELILIQELAEELEGTLRAIAYADLPGGFGYIKEAQLYYEQKYGKYIHHIKSDIGTYNVLGAYDIIQYLKKNDSLEDIAEECHNALAEYLMTDDIIIEHNQFEEFFTKNPELLDMYNTEY